MRPLSISPVSSGLCEYRPDEKILSGSGRKRDEYWFDDLKQAARSNNTFSIDYLFTLACEGSHVGRAAAAFLFSLYTGKLSASPALASQLGKDSLRLCEIVFRRNEGKALDERWSIPAEVLLMAGFEVTDESELHTEIVEEIQRQEPALCSYIDDDGMDVSLFKADRLVTSAELDVLAKQLNARASHVHFFDAMRISDESVLTKKINDPLPAALANADARINERPLTVKAIPLLLREHWVLFAIHTKDNGEKSAVVFSSLMCLDEAQKAYLSELSHACGSADRAISFFEENLQEHVPNACGVFVAQAMEQIAQYSANNLPHLVRNYVNACAALEPPQMALFNRNGRAELFGALIDVIRTQES